MAETGMPAKIIDLHLHGIGQIDTRCTDPASILRIAEIEGAAGVSEIVLSIHSARPDVMRARAGAVKSAMAQQMPGQARIAGVHLEGPFLNPVMAGALDAGSFIQPSERALREMTEGCEDVVRIVTIAPELEGAVSLIRRMAKAGLRVNMGHSNATYEEAEAGFRAGATGITHLFNAMRAFHHRAPGIAGFGLLNKNIYVELIADIVHLHRKTVELVFRLKSSGRVILVSDSVRDTGVSRERPPMEKGRLSGGAFTLAEAAQRLIEAGFDEERVARALTTNPHDYLEG
jgi:N-acetylglucosamine-6-phosphate deacetylase